MIITRGKAKVLPFAFCRVNYELDFVLNTHKSHLNFQLGIRLS